MQNNSEKLLEAHLYHIRESLSDIKDGQRILDKRMLKAEKTLLRNTITVEEHQRRSMLLEANQGDFVRALQSIDSSFKKVKTDLKKLESEVKPIQKHVESVTKVMGLFVYIEKNRKMITRIIVFFALMGLGLYFSIVENINLLRVLN